MIGLALETLPSDVEVVQGYLRRARELQSIVISDMETAHAQASGPVLLPGS